MSNILITGGAGFIGSHLAEYYLQHSKNQIVILDNFNDYYSPSVKHHNYRTIKQNDHSNRLSLVKGDIRDKEIIDSLFIQNNFSHVFHLAAMAGVRYSIENPELYLDVNLSGTLNILNGVKNTNVSSLIYASSSSVYGNSTKTPFLESMKVDHPISTYAATKKAGEELCYLYHHLYNINITCLRFFTVYGPRGRPDMAPYKFIDRICQSIPIDQYGDGTSLRDYTYIGDIIDGIILAVEKNFPFEIFNLGRGETIALKDFIALIEKTTGIKAKINYLPKQQGDVDVTLADVAKAKNLLGYNPKYSISEGIERSFKWYQAQSDPSEIIR